MYIIIIIYPVHTFFLGWTLQKKDKRRKPGFQLGIKDRKREIYFFYIEIKHPEKESKHHEEDDFVKFVKMMKLSVDRQISLGMKSPVSFGFLCEDKCQFNHEYIINMVIYSLHPICIFLY
jgi:hypothetical protein